MAKVYIANLGGHDFSDAERYGELVFLTSHGFRPEEVERVAFETAYHLRHFNEDTDYFMPVGQDLVNITAFWVLTRLCKNKINVLYWNYKDRRYIVNTYEPRLLDQVMKNIKIKERMTKIDSHA